jgi:hypothetical protein
LFVPFTLAPGQSRTVVVELAWFVGDSGIRYGEAIDAKAKDESYRGLPSHRPWYAGRFSGVAAVSDYWHDNYIQLRTAAQRFADSLYASSVPPEILEAVATNLTILKSPTVLRQEDGRLWGWEGCKDDQGCCYGSCTHVWNYAQAIPHLFPALERTLRETEFGVSQNESGHQAFRTPLPIRPPVHDFHPAADGQLGGSAATWRGCGACGRRCAGAWTTRSRRGIRGTRACWKSRTTTPTTSSSGAPTACAPASTWARCGPRSRWAARSARTWPPTSGC